MVMCVLGAKEAAQAEAGIWQNHDHNMSPLKSALKLHPYHDFFTNVDMT